MRAISKMKSAALILSGAAAGAAVALLFAPKAGYQTRKDIRKFSRKTAHQFDDFKSNLQDQICEGYSQVKRLVRTA